MTIGKLVGIFTGGDNLVSASGQIRLAHAVAFQQRIHRIHGDLTVGTRRDALTGQIRKGVDIAAGQHRRLCIAHLHTHQCLYVGAILDVLIFSRKGGNQGCTAGKSQLGVRPQVHHIDVGVAPALNHRYGHIGELLHKQL